MILQNLAAYRTPPNWHPCAPTLVQTLWFCRGAIVRGPVLFAHLKFRLVEHGIDPNLLSYSILLLS